MNELNINYTDHKGKYIYCLRNDRGFGIRKGKGYKIVKVEENNSEYFYTISTEKFPDGIGFKAGSKSFMSVEESQAKLRELKLTRILGGSEDQLFYTNED